MKGSEEQDGTDVKGNAFSLACVFGIAFCFNDYVLLTITFTLSVLTLDQQTLLDI